jgi:alpha-tubulin suppressor-like RCC1 family protein
VDVSAGSTHAAVIDEDGQIYTWGEGGNWWRGGGQLGHGVRANEPTPKLGFLISACSSIVAYA